MTFGEALQIHLNRFDRIVSDIRAVLVTGDTDNMLSPEFRDNMKSLAGQLDDIFDLTRSASEAKRSAEADDLT